MNKFLVRNISELKKLKGKRINDKTTKATKKRVDEIIELYTERKIANVATAENYIKGLTSDNKRIYDKTFEKYKSTIQKFKEQKPLNKRMEEAKKKNQKNTYFINFEVFTTRKPVNEKIKPSFKYLNQPYYIDSFDIGNATITVSNFPKDIIGQRIFRFETLEDQYEGKINPRLTEVMALLKNDTEFDELISTLQMYYQDNIFHCIKITSVELVNKKGEKFNILNENLTDAVNVSIYHYYIHTPLKMEASTIKKAIEKGHCIDNMCWINALIDFYKDTIMNEKTRKRLTVERIVEILGRNDFYEKGASIQEMEKVFVEFSIQVRIYNYLNALVYKYDPPKRNHHIKTFYALVKNNHIYVLNHDLKSIQQKQDSKIPTVKASTDYYISDKEEPPKFKMINNIDDILKIEIVEDTKQINLIAENNCLTELFFQLLTSGYEPKIRFQVGIITEIIMKLNKTKYIIKTQNLVKTSADGCIAVSNETAYNNMNLAFFNFHKSLFKVTHKSFYNDIDIKILDETRTVVPVGLFNPDCKTGKGQTEIDLSKAFAYQLVNIVNAMVFNQFDIWKVYNESININELSDYTLYYVEVAGGNPILSGKLRNRMLFFNKKYNLIYGKLLKQITDTRILKNIKVLYYKTPSQVHNVDYEELFNELKGMTISDIEEEDKYLKKLIVNVLIGLLEKGGATDQKSLVFKNLAEAINYQSEYGGKLHKLKDVEQNEEGYERVKQSLIS
jgi:hypothetical protein